MTISNIVAGFHTTGIYPLDGDAIQLPGEGKLADKLITPNVNFAPFKRYPCDALYTSSDIKAAKSSLHFVNPRPNSLRDIAEVKTPEVKSKPIKAPEDKVVDSSVFTDPPANIYGIKGSHDKATKCKYMYMYSKHYANVACSKKWTFGHKYLFFSNGWKIYVSL